MYLPLECSFVNIAFRIHPTLPNQDTPFRSSSAEFKSIFFTGVVSLNDADFHLHIAFQIVNLVKLLELRKSKVSAKCLLFS
jgi:hypothetical protein